MEDLDRSTPTLREEGTSNPDADTKIERGNQGDTTASQDDKRSGPVDENIGSQVKDISEHVHPSSRRRYLTGHEIIVNNFFLSESEFQKAREASQYDIILIGSGFCAFAVAERAMKNNPSSKILILERGSFLLPEHIQNLPPLFASVLRGSSETFPWTIAAETGQGRDEVIRRLHGMRPFFGGCSTLWSAWCPRPSPEEMHAWPEETKRNIQKYFASAEKLLQVQKVDTVVSNDAHNTIGQRPVYGVLQKVVGELITHATKIENVYRVEPASLASDSKHVNRIDFQKFSVPGKLLGLASKQANMPGGREDALLQIAINCVVEKIHQQDGIATALETSRGIVQIRDAHLVLAMGTLPATTLVRNSFPQHNMREQEVGENFSAHFRSSIIARIPRRDLENGRKFGDLEIAAFYVAGTVGGDYNKQFHIQLSVMSDQVPDMNAQAALRYMPNIAKPSMQQLETSQDYVIFACTVLGELDADNENNWFRHNPDETDITTNSILQVFENDNDKQTWDAMDAATFDILEQTLSQRGPDRVQYWHDPPGTGWESRRPGKAERRVDTLVHDSSTLYIGEEEPAPVDLNYRLRGSENVYITGGGLWPRGGSWNPTMVMVAMAQHLADQLTDKADPEKKVQK